MPFAGSSPGTWILQLDPPGADMPYGTTRTMLDINNPSTGIQVGGTSSGTGPDFGTAQLTEMLAQEGQYGSTLAAYLYPNRTVTIPLGLGMGGPGTPDANSALNTLAQKVGLLQREGGWLLRQREGGDAMYLDVVDAQLEVPDVWGETGGVEPGVTLTLICRPDFYGDEITLDSIPCTGYCEAVLASAGVTGIIEGDQPARCRLDFGGSPSWTQQGLVWGFRSRYYSPASTAALVIEAETLAPYGGSVATISGASGGATNNVMKIDMSTAGDTYFVALMELASGSALLTHEGTYRVFARCFAVTGTPSVFLEWGLGPAVHRQVTQNTAQQLESIPDAQIVDLGTIRLDPSPAGSLVWGGALMSTANAEGDTVAFDVVYFQPLDDRAGVVQPYFGDGATAEIGTDGVYYYNAGNWGPGLALVGDLPRIPPSGLEQRPVQLFAKPCRNPFATITDDPGIDTFTVQVKYRPCYMFRP